jgi:hypothetical protein
MSDRNERVTCPGCRANIERAGGVWGLARAAPAAGNPANVGMGHQYYFTRTGRIAACLLTARSTPAEPTKE